jgi:hypothetical protein
MMHRILAALSLDVFAVACFLVASTVWFDLDRDEEAMRYLVLAGLVPPAATLGALSLAILTRRVATGRPWPAIAIMWIVIVLSGLLLLLSTALSLLLLQGP